MTQETKWPYKAGVRIFGLFVLLNITIFTLHALHLEYHWFDMLVTNNETINLVSLYAVTLITFLLPLIILIHRYSLKPKDLSFKKNSLPDIFKLIGIAYILIFTSSICLFLLSELLPFDIPGLGPQTDLPFFEGTTSTKVIGAVIAIGIAPIVEEIFFRGFLLKTLLMRFKFTHASILTAAIFAFFHFQFESILGIFILSLIINYIYERGGLSIIPTIAFHMANNTVAMLVLLNYDKLTELAQ